MSKRVVCSTCHDPISASPQGGWTHDRPAMHDHAATSTVIDAGRERVALLQAEMIVGQIEFIERAANLRARMEEDTLRDEVINVLRAQGYTVIPPGEGS